MWLREFPQSIQKRGTASPTASFNVAGCFKLQPTENGRVKRTAKDFNTESEEKI